MTKRNVTTSMGLSLLAACAAITLNVPPAAAHSQAACKIEALYACQDMQGDHALCVKYAEQLCANHSHGGNGPDAAGTDYHSPGANPLGSRRGGNLAIGSLRGGQLRMPAGSSLRIGGGPRMR
jgi:hypothetical protein